MQKNGDKMKSFQDYLTIKELAVYDASNNAIGNSVLDPGAKDHFTAAIKAFEIILSKNSPAALNFIKDMAKKMPEVAKHLKHSGILHKNHHDRGFGDMNSDADVVAGNAADSYENPIG